MAQFKQLIHQNSILATISSSTYHVDRIANGNISLTGLFSVDGIVLTAGEKVLCTSQTDQTQNGVWIASSSAWARDPNFATGANFRPGLNFHVLKGSTNRNRISQFIPNFDPITYNIVNPVLGTDPIKTTKTNTAGYNYNTYDLKYIGLVKGYCNNTDARSKTANVFVMNQTFRRFGKIKNLKLFGKMANFTATTNKVEVALVPIHQKWGYLHTVDEVRDAYRTNTWNPTGINGEDGIIVLGEVLSSATPANDVMFQFSIPDLTRDVYALRLRLTDSTASDVLASFTSEIYLMGENK